MGVWQNKDGLSGDHWIHYLSGKVINTEFVDGDGQTFVPWGFCSLQSVLVPSLMLIQPESQSFGP